MLRFLAMVMALSLLLFDCGCRPSMAQNQDKPTDLGSPVGITSVLNQSPFEKTSPSYGNAASPGFPGNLFVAAADNQTDSHSGKPGHHFSTRKKILFGCMFLCLLGTSIAVPIAVGLATHHPHHNGNQGLVAYNLIRTRQLQLSSAPVPPSPPSPPPTPPVPPPE